MTARKNSASLKKQASSAMKIKRVMPIIWPKRGVPGGPGPAQHPEKWRYRGSLELPGYATRKLGRTDEGIGYYQRSIALDPTYAKVREYLGEAWLAKGRPDLAKEQLKTIATPVRP
ncbi:Predicted O-linked N-acetylglucosamine transferase, SPINDLY family [Klebsiella michiganensis]|nr:Predicted O-linked N-acetylglucosamine transferase, SPINDLY family [Klebsiella michiganensis]